MVTDTEGRPLWLFLASDDRWRLPADLARGRPRYLGLLIAYEDKRFCSPSRRRSPRRRPRRSGRRRAGRIVSGASTIAMQTVRLLSIRSRARFAAKLAEMLGRR